DLLEAVRRVIADPDLVGAIGPLAHQVDEPGNVIAVRQLRVSTLVPKFAIGLRLLGLAHHTTAVDGSAVVPAEHAGLVKLIEQRGDLAVADEHRQLRAAESLAIDAKRAARFGI